MIGRTNTGGGGGGLNFKVVGGTTKPNNPKENMIWVNTSEKITNWNFSATEPETPSEGMVWFFTGKNSLVEFNALTKNSINVYPLSAKQYVSGSWVDVEAHSYQSGAWVAWMAVLYDYGNECTNITGGWEKKNKSSSSTAIGTVTMNEDHVYITNVESGSTGISTVAQIDLTPFSKLHVVCSGDRVSLSVAEEFPSGAYAATGMFDDMTTEKEAVLDISSVNGLMRIMVSNPTISGIFVYKVWLD